MRRIVLPLLLIVLSVSVVLVLAQASVPTQEQWILKITVAHSTCSLQPNGSAVVTPEATSEAVSAAQNVAATLKAPVYPLLTLGSDCANVIPQLHVPNNDVLWIKFSILEDEDP